MDRDRVRRGPVGGSGLRSGGAGARRSATVPAGRVQLDADLTLPADPGGLVVFAHGSGSSRRSARNQAVAAGLREADFATLLLDLLDPAEEQVDLRTRELRFDIRRLGERVVAAVDWAAEQPDLAGLPIGIFGASTGAAAALVAAAARPEAVTAVVSRGGRPDLAGDALPGVRAPVLLIVGGADEPVLDLNRQAVRRLRAPHRLEVVPGATHLFEEPGALERVTVLAREWFRDRLVGRPGCT